MNRYRRFLVPILFIIWSVSSAMASVTLQSTSSIDTPEAPLDAVASDDGKRIYVLTKTGDILIYASGGELEDKVHVGAHVDFISPGPSENQLLVGSSRSKTVRTITLENIYEIDTSASPFEGPVDAPVVIAVFMDYQCPYCVRLRSTLEEVLEQNPGKVKIAYKQFPLKMHAAALSAASAALVAFEEGKFQELHTLMEDDYRSLDDEKILDMASSLGFDRDEFQRKMADPDLLERIQKDIEDGKNAGVSGIPSVFINGRRLQKRTLEQFQVMIDRELMLKK